MKDNYLIKICFSLLLVLLSVSNLTADEIKKDTAVKATQPTQAIDIPGISTNNNITSNVTLTSHNTSNKKILPNTNSAPATDQPQLISEEKRLPSYTEIFKNRLQALALIPRRFTLAKEDELIGNQLMQHVVKADETLMELARVYGMGFNEIILANPTVDPWKPKIESKLTGSFIRILPGLDLPAEIIVNIPEMRLYHWVDKGLVDTYPIGVGREGFITPTADTHLIRKKENPSWYVPASIRQEKPELPAVVKPGPENPLGSHALYLALPNYLLHGTNQPLGIGRRVSHGCIRLYPEDVTDFYNNAKIGANVRLVHEPVKAGWRNNQLYMEVFPLFSEEIAQDKQKQLATLATTVVNKALSRRPDVVVKINWGTIDRLVHQPDGIPHLVGELINDIDGAEINKK
ncbi:MAG: L,D-transpeptidase family protein [Magnetococcales bacterium]|nr:L,D-transpeptidase family protein [Magnetococcales bacterium]